MYLDHNATTPLRADARAAMQTALEQAWGNPSSPHAVGRAAAAALDRARAQVAALGGWDPRGLVFTSGATEANALALAGLRVPGRDRCLVSAVEHPSVLVWGEERLPVDGQGRVDLGALDRELRSCADQVAVVSVMTANNETGVLQPLHEIAAVTRAHGVLLHTDASQAPGRVPLDLPADLVTLSSHKLGGPRGVGALWVRPDLHPRMQAQVRGGPQERGLRGGTEPVALAAGFGAAAAGVAGEPLLDAGDRDHIEAYARSRGAQVLGAGAPRLPNTTALLFEHPGDLLVMALDLEGVAASTGSACASGAAQKSHVVAAMGAHGVPLRLSTGRQPIDPDAVIAVLGRVLERMEAACAS